MEEEMEDMIVAQEEEVKESIIEKLERKGASSSATCPGCGLATAMRLVIETMNEITIIGTSGCSGLSLSAMSLKMPFVYADSNPVALAQRLDAEKKVCIAGDGSTADNLQSVIYAAQKNSNILYICLNNHGYCSLGEHIDKNFSEFLANHAKYVAAAAISSPEDLIKKLMKASKMEGFRFLEILCPCPSLWGFSSSDTALVSRLAVETGIWPLYEVEGGSIGLTEIPRTLEPVTRFISAQKKFKNISKPEEERMQKIVHKKWKKLRKS